MTASTAIWRVECQGGNQDGAFLRISSDDPRPFLSEVWIPFDGWRDNHMCLLQSGNRNLRRVLHALRREDATWANPNHGQHHGARNGFGHGCRYSHRTLRVNGHQPGMRRRWGLQSLPSPPHPLGWSF